MGPNTSPTKQRLISYHNGGEEEEEEEERKEVVCGRF